MKQDNKIFLHRVLKAIADSIIQIFIPLYILKVTGNYMLAITYLVAYSAFTLLSMLVLKKFIQKFGILSIILHFIPIIATEALISFLSIDIWVVLGSALLMSLAQTLYSIPLNILFNFGDKDTNVAKFQVATNIGKLAFILISGFVLSSQIKNSFLIMSITSAVFYIVSIVPIFASYKQLKESYEVFKPKQHRKVADASEVRFRIFHICFGTFQTTLDNVIPLYLYINNLSFESVTIFLALIELIKACMNYLAKYLVKIRKQNVSCIISCVVFIVSITCIMFIKNSIALYVLSCVCSITFPLTFVPMFKNYCEKLKQNENFFEGMTIRDIDIFLGRPFYFGLGMLGLGLLPCLIGGVAVTAIMFKTELDICKDVGISPPAESK